MKEQILQTIRNARLGHKRWLNYARAIQMGIPVSKDAVPLFDTDCTFGKWYHGEGQMFHGIPSFDAIDELHAMVHAIYLEIYKLRKEASKKKGGFLTFGNLSEKKRNEKLSKLMDQLQEVSKNLLEQLSAFENDIKAMSELELSRLG